MESSSKNVNKSKISHDNSSPTIDIINIVSEKVSSGQTKAEAKAQSSKISNEEVKGAIEKLMVT